MEYPRAGSYYPRSTGEFLAWFGADEDCLDYLEWLRWLAGSHARHVVTLAAGGWALWRLPSVADVVPVPAYL